MSTRKAQPHRFGVFNVKRVRVTGSWALPMNNDGQVKWTDEEEPPVRRKDWPEMRRRGRQRG